MFLIPNSSYTIMETPTFSLRASLIHRLENLAASGLAKALPAAFVLSALVMPVSAATNLVKNGSFENNSGPGIVYGNTSGYYIGTNVPDWYFVKPSTNTPFAGVDNYDHARTNTSQAAQFWGAAPGYQNGNGFSSSPDGGYFWFGDGDQSYAVRLKQDITGLTIGEQYDLSFFYAYTQEIFRNQATDQVWEVFFGNDIYNTGWTHVPAAGFSGWHTSARTFTATAATQTLQFLAHGTNGLPPFLLLDGVKLTAQNEPPSPPAGTPGPVPLLGVAATMAWSRRLRRRIKRGGMN
jgi:hypothetical protein